MDNTPTCPPSIDPINTEKPTMSNTLAKAKAASFIQPMAALALTPNVHTQVTPDDAAVIDLHNSSINVLNIVDPAATLAVHVDHDNFAALGGKLFVMHIDSTDACELTLNYVRGNTVLKSQVIAIPANSHTTLTAGSIIQADNQVKLLIVGNLSLDKGQPTVSNDNGVLTINGSYLAQLLHYSSGLISSVNASGMLASIPLASYQAIELTLPTGNTAFSLRGWLSNDAEAGQAATPAPAIPLFIEHTGTVLQGSLDTSASTTETLSLTAGDVITLINHGNQQLGLTHDGSTLYATANLGLSGQVYLHLMVTSVDAASVPDLALVILPAPVMV